MRSLTAGGKPLPKPDRRRVRTRNALVEAGMALFSLRPIEAVSVDEITQAADLAKGSFYNYFTDKEALAREVAREVREEVEARVAVANEAIKDPAIRVARALHVFALYAREKPDRAGVLTRLHSGATLPHAPSNRGLRADLEAGLRLGRFSGFALETGLISVIATVQITMLRILDPAAPRLSETALIDIAALLLRGLGLSNAAARKAAMESASPFDQSQRRKAS